MSQAGAVAGNGEGRAWVTMNSEGFREVLLGLHKSHWSGSVMFRVDELEKRVYFWDGEIAFASSPLIDDRLGEVIYRYGMIGLEDHATAAAKVDRNQKFGQVLLASGVIDHVKLWRALRLQIREILRSAFLNDVVQFVLFPVDSDDVSRKVLERSLPPSPMSAPALIHEVSDYGAVYRGFRAILGTESELSLKNPDLALKGFKEGTFAGDIVRTVKDQAKVGAIASACKLNDLYALGILMQFVHKGFLSLTGARKVEGASHPSWLGPLASQIDAHEMVLQAAKKAFLSAQGKFPARDFAQFAGALNDFELPILFVSDDGSLSQDSRRAMTSLCVSRREVIPSYCWKLSSLTQFVVEVCSDLLTPQQSEPVRRLHKELAA